MRKVRAGEQIRQPSASEWNRIVDAVDAIERLKNTKPKQSNSDSGIAWVKNTTASTLGQFAIVGLDDAIVTDPQTAESPTNEIEFKQQKHIFNAVAPSLPKHAGKWAVTLDVIEPNAIGRVRIDGVVICKAAWPSVAGASSSTIANRDLRKYAEAIAGDTEKLRIGPTGSAQVLWVNDVTADSAAGEGWAIIRLGNALTKLPLVRFALTSGLSIGGTASATIISDGADDGTSISVADWAGNEAETDDQGLAWYDSDSEVYWVIEVKITAEEGGGGNAINVVRFTLTANLAASGTATATVTSGGADNGTTITVTDWAGNAASSGDKGIAWKVGSVYYVIEIKADDRPHFITGSMASGGSTFAGATAETFTLGSIVGIDRAWTGATTVEVTNPQLVKVWMNGGTAGNCVIKCQWNQATEAYEVLTATQKYVVHGVRIGDGCSLQLLNATGTQNWSTASDFAIPSATVVSADWVTSIYIGDSKLKFDKRCTTNQVIVDITSECP